MEKREERCITLLMLVLVSVEQDLTGKDILFRMKSGCVSWGKIAYRLFVANKAKCGKTFLRKYQCYFAIGILRNYGISGSKQQAKDQDRG